MLGRRSPQASIFDGDQIYLDHVGRNTFYAFLAREGHDLFKDEDFAQLYDQRLGRPSVPPSRSPAHSTRARGTRARSLSIRTRSSFPAAPPAP